MMLDSSLGKILSTKPVEPSIPSNSDGSATKDVSTVTTTKSEAEVRIVFRFLVEEHIVFNGKVEKVKQLESEELSRTVSRIAWDGAKDEKKLILNKELIKNDEIIDQQGQEANQINRCSPAEVSKSADCTTSVGDVNSSTLTQHKGNPVEENDTALSSPISGSKNSTSPKQIESNTPKDEHHSDENVLGCTEYHKCDNDIVAPDSNHISETYIRSESSFETQHNDESQLPDVDQDHTLHSEEQAPAGGTIPLSEVDSAAISAAESQMIVEALYDCVYNVDLESRKSDQTMNVNGDYMVFDDAIEDEFDDTLQRDQQNITGNDTSKEITRLDKGPLMEAANVPPNNDTANEATQGTEEDHFRVKDAQPQQARKDDLSSRLISSKKLDMNPTSRRRNTCDSATPNRRNRRSGVKEQRSSRVPITDRLGENTIDSVVANELVDHSSGLLTRHSKVFAKWSDNHFYPGTILKLARDRKFEIGFFDGAHKDVVETDLIPLSNILGKQVRVSIAKDYCVNAIVHEQLPSNNGQPMFDVEYQQNGLVKKCVPLCDIFLTAEQGIPLINQPFKSDKKPDESMFAGVDLDNIVHVKRSRRLQEMEDLDASEDIPGNSSSTAGAGRRKRGQYNMRNTAIRSRSSNTKAEVTIERGLKRSHSDINNEDTPLSSCSPDNLKPHLHSSNSNPPSESSSPTGSSNSASIVHEMGQEFYFESSSPHRTKTSLLL